MSYENTHCVCGGQKLRETFLCAACEQSVTGTFDRTRMDDASAPWEDRRSAAIRVLAQARQRQCNRLPLAFSAS